MTDPLSTLTRLEAESIHILREAAAEATNPVMLFSADKDSTVLAHLATPEFTSLLDFRDAFVKANGFELLVRANEAGRASRINPFDYGDQYTTLMRTEPLKAALDEGGHDVIFGGARRAARLGPAPAVPGALAALQFTFEPGSDRPGIPAV